jgi:NRPS condensation-like uncharacterized protein
MIENRLLDTHEQAVEILNRAANSYHVVTISRISGLLSVEILRQALDLIQKRHPRLNSRIVGELNNLRFETGAIQIPLKVVNKLDSCQWQKVVLEELNEKIASDKVLMRAVLVRIESENNINYLITTLHHTIIDGLSSVRLHSEILTYCQKIASGEVISDVASLSPLTTIQEMLPKSMQGLSGFIKSIFYLLRIKLQLIRHKPAYLGYEKYVPVESRMSNMLHRQLDAEITSKIVSACKREKTTVHGTLCAALLLTIAKLISYNKEPNLCLSCLSYVNLRQRLQTEISDENLGMLVACINSFHTVRDSMRDSIKDTMGDNTLFWDLARNVKQKLEAGLENDDIFSNLLSSKMLANFVLHNPKQIPCSLAVTNIGRVNIPEVYGEFKLEEISVVVAVALFAGVVVVGVSTFAGKMFLNFMFSEPSISRKTIEEIADDAIAYLKISAEI